MTNTPNPRFFTGFILVVWIIVIRAAVPILANGKLETVDLGAFIFLVMMSTVLIGCFEKVIMDLNKK